MVNGPGQILDLGNLPERSKPIREVFKLVFKPGTLVGVLVVGSIMEGQQRSAFFMVDPVSGRAVGLTPSGLNEYHFTPQQIESFVSEGRLRRADYTGNEVFA